MDKISGHDFHYNIEDRVKNNGWEILSEQSYLDDVELKPRKVDFVAFQRRESYNPRGNQLVLVVECKYLDHDVKFWLRDNPKNHNAYFIDGYNTEELFLGENHFHFFVPTKVAVELKEDTKKKDTMYEAIMQSSKALIYLRQDSRTLHTKGLFYPVVVYGGSGRATDQDSNELRDVMYYHQYEWRDPKTQIITNRSLYVDVIHESSLEKYLEDIFKKEMDNLMGFVFFQNRMEKNRNREGRGNPAR